MNKNPTKEKVIIPKRDNDKSIKIFGVLILGALIFGTVVSLTSFGDTPTQSTENRSALQNAEVATTSSESSQKVFAKIGEPVRDGKFEFVVSGILCGETKVGSDYLSHTAQGQFCKVSLTVKNIGTVPVSFNSSDQFAFTSDNKKYSTDSKAAIYSESSSNTWYSNINPGNSVSGDLYFDMPKDIQPTLLELHDSAFSGGVKVLLQ